MDDPYRPEGLMLQVEDSGRTWFVDQPCFPAFIASLEAQVGDVIYLTMLDDGEEEIVPLQVKGRTEGGGLPGLMLVRLRFRHEMH